MVPYMRKIIFILSILLLFSGCGLQRKTYCERKKNKVARLLRDCPQILDTTSTVDTVIIRDTAFIVIDKPIDSSGIDSLLLLYCDALAYKDTTVQGRKDTAVIYRERLVRQYIFKECEKINDGRYSLKDQHGDSLIVELKGRTIKVFQDRKVITIEKKIIVPCETNSFRLFQNKWKDWVMIFCFGLVAGIIVMKISQKKL